MHPAVPGTARQPLPTFVFRHQVEALLASEDYGKDLASVNNLLKKHQLLEADISAHEVIRGGGWHLWGSSVMSGRPSLDLKRCGLWPVLCTAL